MTAPETVVLVDAMNVLRSTWPNIAHWELVELCRRWAESERVHAVLVFDGDAPAVDPGSALTLVSSGRESADDWIAREAASLRALDARFRLVTSDRELRTRAAPGAEQTIGGGTFARILLDRRG